MKTAAALVLIGALMITSADAQSARDFTDYAPQAVATRIERAEAPVIDGDLTDAVWSRALPIEEFYQIEPVEGAAPSQPTRAYILYDERTLYVAIHAFDSEPHLIRRQLMERDPPLQDDDGLRIIIDSFGTMRDGYFFGTNANGARSDALVENNSTFRPEWDTIWNVKSNVVEDGWVAEFAIPFQSFSFDASLEAWGFQIIRTIRRNNEEIRWSNIDRSRSRIDLTSPGRLSGIEGAQSGVGLEAQLFVSGTGSYDWEAREDDYEINPSANIFYKITPALTGSLTFNTDFSDSPLDSRQVNTGRFSLFFPETRDFFLQDAAIFEYGGRVYKDSPNGLPFFTRRIGIVRGQPVDIIAGAKLSGKAGPINLGLITARTGDAGAAEGQTLSAARASVPVLAESKAGLVFTHGDPTGLEANTVGGVDFQYKNSRVLPGTIFADIAYTRSFDDGIEDDMAAAEFAYRSNSWNGTLRLRDIGEGYQPRLGFVNRTGIRRYNANFWRTYQPQDSFIRFAETGLWVNTITDLGDRVIDRFWGGWAGGANSNGDELWFNYENAFVDIREPFSIAGEVPVSAGEYEWTQYEISAEMTQARPFALGAEVAWGQVYDGDYLRLEGELSLRPSRHFSLGAEHEYIDFALPSGEVGIHISTIESTIAFSPTMTLKTDIQYDNISENFALFSRFVWEPKPHQEVFVSVGHSALIERTAFPGSFRAQATGVSLRFGHTVRM